MWKSKNAKLYAEFDSVEKRKKIPYEQKYKQKRDGICTFFTFNHVCQGCFAYNFLCCIFVKTFLPI
jgi:hypothetical protein